MPNPCGTGFTAAPSLPDTPVRYRPAPGQTYLYCNNPEQIGREDYLADRDLGNTFLSWARARGCCCTWYEHVNRLDRPIGYGVQVCNPGPQAVMVDVTALGFGTDPFTPWLQLATGTSGAGGLVGTLRVPPGRAAWLQRNGGIGPGQVFNGAVRFRVRDGEVCAFWSAYERFERIGERRRYLGWVRTIDPPPFPQDEGRVYKGVARARGRDAPGCYRLPARLDLRVSRLLLAPATWVSHWCPTGGADVQDILVPTAGPPEPCATRVSCLTAANLANWGVTYDYRLQLCNDGDAPRRAHLLVSQLRPGVASNVVVGTPDGLAGCGIGAGPGTSGPTWDFYDFDVRPGEGRTVRWSLVLGASSGGQLTNAVAVE